MIVHLHYLFTSPGHNYYEHHGKPAGRHETIEKDSLVLVARFSAIGQEQPVCTVNF